MLCSCNVSVLVQLFFMLEPSSYCDLTTVCDHTIILCTYKTVFRAFTYFQLFAHPKFAEIPLIRMGNCIAGVLGCTTKRVLMPGSMLKCCCEVVLVSLKVTNHLKNEDFQTMLSLQQTGKSL